MKAGDLKILQGLKQGKPGAFKELFDQYYLPLCAHSLKYCDSFEMAEDIVQDFFIKFWDKKLYLKFDKSCGPYLFKSIKNNTLQAIKTESKYHFQDIEEEANKLFVDDDLEILLSNDESSKLYRLIEELPKKSREVFKSIALYNLKYKEVAAKLGISVNTVKTHYARALKKLRKALE